MKSAKWTTLFAAFAGVAIQTGAWAMYARQVDIPERIQGSDEVVVATVEDVQPRWQAYSANDRIIVSQIRLKVSETLKGPSQDIVLMDLIGGTLDGITLEASEHPKLRKGERAVFFLERGKTPVRRPHFAGMGILKLSADDHVEASGLTLDHIRGFAKPH